MLLETIKLTKEACSACALYNIPVKILTKRVDWLDKIVFDYDQKIKEYPVAFGHYANATNKKESLNKFNVAFGFTLTGHDELEPHASTNQERIEAMKKLHDAGFKTWASIEPVVDVDASLDVIARTQEICDLYKVGLMSGKKYEKSEIYFLISELSKYAMSGNKVYIKDSILKAVGLDRNELPNYFVNRDYNLFKTDLK